jgi:microcystin-dependent protein
VKIANTGAATGATAKHGVGEIIPWIADTYPDDYLECKGQIVAIAAYNDLYTVIGNKYNATTGADGVSTFALPDLRGYFLRGMAGSGGEGAVGIFQDDRTRLPRTANFTGTAASAGDHIHGLRTGRYANFGTGGGARAVNNLDGNDYEVFTGNTLSAGAHTHNVTINGGGDAETRPKSFSVRWLIRYKAIDGGAMGPRGQNGIGIPAITATDDKKIMTVVAGVAAWAAPAAALPNGTAVGQKLEWNGTIWVPAADKIVTVQGSEVNVNQSINDIGVSPKASLTYTATVALTVDSTTWPQVIARRSGNWMDFSTHRVSAMWISNTSDNKVAGGDGTTWAADSSGLYCFGTNLKANKWYSVKVDIVIYKASTKVSTNVAGIDASGNYRDCTVTVVYDAAFTDITSIGFKTGVASKIDSTIISQ